MRVLLFSKPKRTTQATEHLLTAFRRHPDVTDVRLVNHKRRERFFTTWGAGRQIAGQIRRYRPHLTLINNRDIRPEWIELCGEYGVTSCVYHEMVPQPPDAQFAVGRMVDFLYLAGVNQIEDFENAGAKRVRMLMRGCSRDNHYPLTQPVEEKWDSDVSFIGKPRRGIRNELIEAVSKHCNLRLWGEEWHLFGFKSEMNRVRAPEYRQICAGSKIMLGLNCGGGKTLEQIQSFSRYTSNRTRLTMGCGGFVLTNWNDGLEEVFTPGEHLDLYRSIDDCLEKIDYYLAHPEERERIAKQGCELVRNSMTFDHFVAEVIRDAQSLESAGAR
jgi:spore maturation protein CgeB